LSSRAASRLAWSLWAVSPALVTGGLILGVATLPEAPLYEYWLTVALISPTFATLGALIVSRRPGNVIGWIFLVPGVGGGVQLFSGQYATTALFSKTLPGGAVAAWLSTLVQTSIVISIVFLILLFPTGRLLSPRWRPVAWIAGAALVVSVVALALTPGPVESFPSVRNPFGIEATAAVLDPLDTIGGWTGLACFVAAILSLILRFYRSRGDERLQLKWFAYAATLGFLAILFGGEGKIISTLVWTLGPLSLPISAGIAILRYRLYDIDVIINRTLVYGALTAMLAGVYFGGVVSLQSVFRALTGQGSTLAVVASTLAIAALFSPLRRRIQWFIDRRFYRKKYDAEKTLQNFSARRRDEVDLDQLTDDLVMVVRETLQPTHVSLWLRPPQRGWSEHRSRPRDDKHRQGDTPWPARETL
jgi:hypothetical protein